MSRDPDPKDVRDAASSEAQAEIVRAFYDAAGKVLVLREKQGHNTQAVYRAISDLEKVFVQAEALGSEEFTKSLKDAADAYFTRAAARSPVTETAAPAQVVAISDWGPAQDNEG